MSAKGMFFKRAFNKAEEKVFAREELIYNVTEDLLVLMEDLDVSKKELASRMGKSRSFVTQVLSGARNMTLGTLSDICFTLGVTPKVSIEKSTLKRELDVDCEVDWQQDTVSFKHMKTIVKTENVYDCRDKDLWQNQAA